MFTHRIARLEASTGVVAGLLFLVAFAIPGKPPSPDATAARIAAHLADRRDVVLASDLLIAIASAAFLWFLGHLYGRLSAAGDDHLSAAAILAAVMGTAVILAGAAVQAGLVLNSAAASDALVRLGFDTYNALITIAGAPLAVAAGAAALSGARTGALPRWLARTGAAVAILQLATLPGLVVEAGAFAAGGAVALLAFAAIAGWFIAASVVMVRRS